MSFDSVFCELTFSFLRGTYLVRRMKEREKEIEEDILDRQREKEELDELRKKLVEEGHPNPDAEVERVSLSTSNHTFNLIKSRVVSIVVVVGQ